MEDHIHDTYEDGGWDNGLVVEDKRVYAKLLKFFRIDYRKVPEVSYVRWLNRTELQSRTKHLRHLLYF